jgi:hypothetical protein
MATIKLGSLTLGNVALGSSTIGDTRKLGKTKIFRAEAIKNHTLDKTVSNFVTKVVPNNNPSEGIGGNVDEGSNWLLANSVWNDNGVWDDTQNWND